MQYLITEEWDKLAVFFSWFLLKLTFDCSDLRFTLASHETDVILASLSFLTGITGGVMFYWANQDLK